MHPTRRAPYEAIINHDVFHHVSPANYKHFANAGESEAEYSQRLADELEAKILELGAENVAAFWAEPMCVPSTLCASCRLDSVLTVLFAFGLGLAPPKDA